MQGIEQQIEPYIVESMIKASQVLVIDDSEDMRILEKAMLEIDGHCVRTAESGAEAIEILNCSYEPDLILLDMKMKKMSGPEFLDVLAEVKPDLLRRVPVVFVTGMEEVPRGRAVGLVRKPILNIDHFLQEVRQFIADGQRNKHVFN